MKRNRRAAVGAFIVTVIVLTAWIGCLVADANTARMTFGSETQAMTGDKTSWTLPSIPTWITILVPAGWRAAWWWMQTERDTVEYWLR